MKYMVLLLCLFTKVALGCDNGYLAINNSKDLCAKILLKDNDSLRVSILAAGKQLKTESIDIPSERKNHITFEDYNRDGYKDFSVWHLDEGMGSYKIYRLFIFSSIEGKFNEIKPACGDEFINIKSDGENLINVIYDHNVMKTCFIPVQSIK